MPPRVALDGSRISEGGADEHDSTPTLAERLRSLERDQRLDVTAPEGLAVRR
jgi:hypothetical protein